MIFPIGDDQVVGGAKPIVSYTLLAVNVVVFLLQFLTYMSQGTAWLNSFVTQYGSIPVEIMGGQDLYTLLTSLFLHGGWMHLIGNMMFLWVFADNIEATIGNINFLIYYILGGLAASMVHILIFPTSQIPSIGASGAIAAVLGTYLILYPRSQIKMIFIVFMSTFRIPALLFLLFWIGQQLLNGYGALPGMSNQTSGVGWWAHIGGFGFGVLAGFLIKSFIRPKTLTVSAPVTRSRRRF